MAAADLGNLRPQDGAARKGRWQCHEHDQPYVGLVEVSDRPEEQQLIVYRASSPAIRAPMVRGRERTTCHAAPCLLMPRRGASSSWRQSSKDCLLDELHVR